MVRLKNRYLLMDILYPDPTTWPTGAKTNNPSLAIHSPTSDALTAGFLAKMIRESVSELYGDWGIGKLGGASAGGIQIKYLSPATSTAIVRCPRAAFRLVWSALTYMSGVPDSSQKRGTGRERGCVFRVIRVSGTMRKAEEEAIRRARREIVRVKNAEERGVGDLIEGIAGTAEKGSAGVDSVVESVMDESEDEDEDEDMD